MASAASSAPIAEAHVDLPVADGKENADGNSTNSLVSAHGEAANATKLRLNPLPGSSAANRPPKPPAAGPAKGGEVPATDQPKSSRGEHQVAQQFSSLSASEVCDVAFTGLATIKHHFANAWELANINGSIIIDDFQLPDLSEALAEIETAAEIKIAFMFQRRKILRNIVDALLLDTSIHVDVREGWQLDALTHLTNVFPTPAATPTSIIKAMATPLSGADTQNQGADSPATPRELFKSKRGEDFKHEFRQTVLNASAAPTKSSNRGALVAKLSDGTEIYGAPTQSDRAPQILDYPTLYDITADQWSIFIRKFRSVDLKARDENKVPMSQCIDPDIIKDVCKGSEGKLLLDNWHNYTNQELTEACCFITGPKNAAQAKEELKRDIFKFNDRQQHQNQFVIKLKKFFRQKENLLCDIAISAAHWTDPDSLTKKMITEAMTFCFTDSETYVRYGETLFANSNNEKIREIIRDNAYMTLPEIIEAIKAHFVDTDANVRNKKGQYHVFPFEDRNKKRNGGDNHGGGGFRGTDGRNQRPKFERPPKNPRGVCGKTDHVCSDKTCFLWGEPEAKPADYQWQVGEPSVWLTNERYKELQTKKPHIKKPEPSSAGESRGGGSVARGGGGYRGGGGHRGGGGYRGGGNAGRGGYRGGGGRGARGGGGRGYASGRRGGERRDSVNEREYLSLTAAKPHNETPTANSREPVQMNESNELGSFYATARVERYDKSRAPRCVSAHMDNGAEMNLIRSSLIMENTKAELACLSRREDALTISNNGIVIGESKGSVLLRFTLDTQDGVAAISYEEWFHLWDELDNEMVLGGTFMEHNGFTTMHKTLVRLRPHTHPKRKIIDRKEADNVSDPVDYVKLEDVDDRPDADGWGFDIGYTNAAAYEQLQATKPENGKPKHFLKRDRVITLADRIQHAREQCAKAVKTIPVIKPGTTSTPIKRKLLSGHGIQSYPLPENMKGKTPKPNTNAPITYDLKENRALAALLAARFQVQRGNVERRLKQSGPNHRISEAELETMLDATMLMQKDANEFYAQNAHLLDKAYEEPGYIMPSKRRFFDTETVRPIKKVEAEEAAPQPQSSDDPKFGYGHTACLTNLVNFPMLNDMPVRVLSFEKETRKYTISIATLAAKSEHRGYWKVAEHNLRHHELPRKKTEGPVTVADCDYKDIGIDHETGQPTLDPTERPVHRQFGKNHSESLKVKIKALIAKYREVFTTDIKTPCKFAPMKIELVPNAKLPRNPRFFKNSPAMREEVRSQLQKMIDAGVVSHSNTAIVSNVLLVKRPGMPGKFRFTIDFRDVNAATVQQKWQMPDVQNQLDRLKGNKIFGALDISQYYHQIELDKSSRYLTGFITEDGVFEYKRVPMGLTNACSHAQSELQKAIDADPILVKYNVRNYFDDIPIAAKTEGEFLEVMEALLKLCQRMNLKVNEEKSVFGVDSITHVGFIVDGDGVRLDPQRIASFKDLQSPTSIKKVQAVLGAMNYVRHFIENFSTRAMPLTSMLGKGKEKARFLWSEDAETAFQDLKRAVLTTKPLAFINYEKEIFIRCDSSQFGAGAVLFQFDDEGRECPVAYASRKYTLAERNYNTFQQEAAVIVWSLEKFAEYFQGHPVVVQSDHRNLSWVKRSAMPQLTRWRIRLQDFDFRIEYIPGPLNICSDGLSRLEVDDKDLMITMGDFLPTQAAAASLLNTGLPVRELAQKARSRYGDRLSGRPQTISELIWEGAELDDDETAGETTNIPHDHIVDNPAFAVDADDEPGKFNDNGDCSVAEPHAPLEQQQPQLPDLSALDGGSDGIISQFHDDIVGHAGVYVTLQRVLRAEKGWADRPQMLRDIDAFLSGCTTCQKFRKRRTLGCEQRFTIEGSPFSQLSVDLLKLPRADCRNNKYVCVIVDNFSRWTHCVPVQDKTAESAARALIQTIGMFGCPLSIRSDGGGEFINDVLAGVEMLLGTKHHKITPYLHTGNSLAEKANRAVLENLRNIIFDSRLRLHGEHQCRHVAGSNF